MSTLIDKKFLPLNRFRPPPLQWKLHPQPSVSSSDFDVPIAVCKSKQSCTDQPITHFVSYDRLTPSFRQFALSLSSVSSPRSYEETILIPARKQAMGEEVDALISRETWELVSAPKDVVVGCR